MRYLRKLNKESVKNNEKIGIPFVGLFADDTMIGASENNNNDIDGNQSSVLMKDKDGEVYYDKFEDIQDAEVLRLVKSAYGITADKVKKSDIYDEDFTAEKGFIFAGNTTITNVSGIGDLIKNCVVLGKNGAANDGLFCNCYNLETIDATDWDLKCCTDLWRFICNCENLKEIKGHEDWDTSNLISLNRVFFCASTRVNTKMKYLNLSNWDVSNVSDMLCFFQNYQALESTGDLSNWDVSKVTDMSYMFFKCYKLKYIGDLSNWDVSKVTDMSYMFRQCTNLQDIGTLENWNIPLCAKTTMMFGGYTDFEMKFKRFKLDNLLKNGVVANTSGMFQLCTQLESIGDISDWNMSNATNISYMFNECLKLQNVGDLSSWDVAKVTDMSYAFASTLCSDGQDLSSWNTSKVTTMKYMFNGNNNDFYCPIVSLGTPPIPASCNTDGMFGKQDKLTTIINAGKISTTVSFSDSPLTHDSVLKLLNALDSSNTGTLTISSQSYNSLSTTEIAIGTNKGWTIAKA